VVFVLTGSAHEAQKTLPSVFIGSIGLLPEIYHECLLARSACVVADKAVDSKLIKEANPIITNICMCLIDQAVNALSKNAQIAL
jgi:hypothetical protein